MNLKLIKVWVIIIGLLTLNLIFVACGKDSDTKTCLYLIEVDYIDGVTDQISYRLPEGSEFYISSNRGDYSLRSHTPNIFWSKHKWLEPAVIRYRVVDIQCEDKNLKNKIKI